MSSYHLFEVMEQTQPPNLAFQGCLSNNWYKKINSGFSTLYDHIDISYLFNIPKCIIMGC